MPRLTGVLVLCALAAAGAGAMQSAGLSLRGRVADLFDLLGGVTVDVTLGGARVATVTTDGEGAFVVNGLAEGEYVVTATRHGYQTTTERVRVTAAGRPGPLAIMMQTEPPGRETVRIGRASTLVNTSWVDVDPWSYRNIRQSLTENRLPRPDAVFIEEVINAFHFDYPAPRDGKPFSVTTEIGPCPWNPRHELALIGVGVAPIGNGKTPPDNRAAAPAGAIAARYARIQIEFSPAHVEAYRMIGDDERRILATLDWSDRRVAGDIPTGQSAAALYEIVRPGADPDVLQSIGLLNYQRPVSKASPRRDSLMTVTVRDKAPAGEVAAAMVVREVSARRAKASTNLGFAAAVAEFGLLLSDSPFKENATWRQAIDLAKRNRGHDADGSRAEFIRLVDLASALKRKQTGETR